MTSVQARTAERTIGGFTILRTPTHRSDDARQKRVAVPRDAAAHLAEARRAVRRVGRRPVGDEHVTAAVRVPVDRAAREHAVDRDAGARVARLHARGSRAEPPGRDRGGLLRRPEVGRAARPPVEVGALPPPVGGAHVAHLAAARVGRRARREVLVGRRVLDRVERRAHAASSQAPTRLRTQANNSIRKVQFHLFGCSPLITNMVTALELPSSMFVPTTHSKRNPLRYIMSSPHLIANADA